MKIKIYDQVDAFTNKLFAINPATENNLSETAFFVKKNDVFEIH